VHDAYLSAAYILGKLKAVDGMAQGMSYWTFSDLFEEPGPPTAPFQGGFGLLNPQGIRKPAYFAYKYLNQLGKQQLATADAESIATWDGRAFKLLVWHFQQPRQAQSNRSFYTKVTPAAPAASVRLSIKGLPAGHYRITTHRTGYDANDAYTAYLRMGAPASLDAAQLQKLRELTEDQAVTARLTVASSGAGDAVIPMHDNDVVLFELSPEDTR